MNYLQKFCRTRNSFFSHLKQTLSRGQRIQRLASQYQRGQLNTSLKERLQDLKTQLFENRDKLSNEEWQYARESLMSTFKHINEGNVDATIMGICNEVNQFSLATNYVAFLRKMGLEPNISTLGRLLRGYYMRYQSADVDALGPEDQREIMEIYANIKKKHNVLDAITCEYLVQGLVATDNWVDALELLEMTRLTTTPSSIAYNVMTLKAFRMGNLEIGWKLLNEMLEDGKQPKCEVIEMYLRTISSGDEQDFLSKFEMLLEFLEKHEFLITEKVSQNICELSEKYSHLMKVTWSTISLAGKCNSCSTYLRDVSISDVEFAQLSNSFLNKVLIRNDVFQKSTPEEVNNFKRYVTATGPYDCVIDGLNVAYSTGAKSPRILANMLADAVSYFCNKNKHVLVLGRRHMNNWPKDTMQFLRKNASIFLTNNLSHDDPFLLYATIKSGKFTDFFSRDLMRSHAFLLGPDLKRIFRRWQQQHQYSLVTKTQTGRIIVKEPVRHLIYTHKVNTTWHVPFKAEYSAVPAENFEIPEKWLCIKFQKI